MDNDVIAVAQRKGGVGKTTLAISVTAELCHRGEDISLIDSDPQGSACRWATPGNLEFPVYEIPLADQPIPFWVREVRKVPESCVVIDTAPNDRALGASIALSRLVLVPCTPSGLDIEATARTIEIINAVRARRRGLPYLILVPNRVDGRILEGRQLVRELSEFGELVAPTIGDRSAFVRAFSAGKSVAALPSGQAADQEIQLLSDLVVKCLAVSQRVSAA